MQTFFKQGDFTVDPNTTPEMLRRKREAIAARLPQFGKAQYIGEGLGQLFQGIGSGRAERALDNYETRRNSEEQDKFNANMNGGPLSVLGMRPQEGAGYAPQPQTEADALGNDVMGALGKPSQDAGPDAIRQGLIARGLPEHIADGFMMNFKDESGLNPGINEQNPTVPGSRGGFGLAQWTGPRRRALEAFAVQRGANVADPNLQLDFLMTELQGPEANAAKSIFGAQDSGQAAAAIVNKFLRPAETHRASREARYTGGQGWQGGNSQPTRVAANGGPDLAYLMEAAANPWLTPEQRSVVGNMIQQKQSQAAAAEERYWKQQDPLYLAQVADAQRKAAGGGATEYGLTPQYGVDADGKPVLIQIGKDGTSTRTPLPDGVSLSKEPIRLDAGTHFILLDPITRQPIAQIPKDKRGEASETAIGKIEGENSANAAAELSGVVSTAKSSMELIDAIVADPALEGITGMVQGNLPPLSQAGVDLNIKLNQLKGKAFLEAFESLKGGGSITETEGKVATAAMARLDRAQSTKEYIAAINELRGVLEAGMNRAKAKAGDMTAPPASIRRKFNPATGKLE